MNKKIVKIIGLSSLCVATLFASTIYAGLLSEPSNPTYKAFRKEIDTYSLLLDKNSGLVPTYSPFEESFNIKNFNDDDITLKYKRAKNNSNGFITLCGGAEGGYIYNPFIKTTTNFNGFDGISSILIKTEASQGKLTLEYGMSSDEYPYSKEISSGVAINFEGFLPSHFRLINKSGVGEEYEVKVTSILISYHSYAYYEQQDDFTSIFSSNVERVLNSGESSTYSFGSLDLGSNNYLRLLYSSTGNIEGTFRYIDSNSQTVDEPFFLEKKDTSFKTFLDAFRNSAVSKVNKRLISMTVKNVSKSSCTFKLIDLAMSSKAYYRNDVYYVGDDNIRLGISMRYGGSIISVQNVSTKPGYNIQEYVTSNEDIKIRSKDKITENVNNVIKEFPNLANIFDLGREIQQSYYFGVDDSNGYNRYSYDGRLIDYNPVQAGDQNLNESQIIDYELSRDQFNNITAIWVKVRACDWAGNNSLTRSYMENLYTVDDGIVNVKNRIIDWYNFSNYPFDDTYTPSFISDIEASNNSWNNRNSTTTYLGKAVSELPAVYFAHPLNYFSANYDGKLIFDPNQGWNMSTTSIERISDANLVSAGTYNGETIYKSGLSNRSYHYSLRQHNENWMGYFNEDFFGVGVYIPANKFNRDSNYRHIFASGNLYESHKASAKTNRYYRDENYNLKTAEYSTGIFGWGKKNLTLESCYTDNTNYVTSILGFYPHEYVPLEWTYAIGADYLDVLRTKFASSDIYNDFTVWSGAEI